MIVLPVQFSSLLVNAHVDGMVPRMTENEYYIITLLLNIIGGFIMESQFILAFN